MELRNGERIVATVCVALLLPLALAPSAVWGGLMRITMTDSTSVEVPYFWEENGEVKFEMAGGIAGIPKAQVASVQEILEAKEFDPQVLLETSKAGAEADQQKMVEELIAAKIPTGPYEKLSPEESMRLLSLVDGGKKNSRTEEGPVHGPMFNVEANFAEMVRSDSGDVVLVVRNILSSQTSLRAQGFTLTLYDADNNVLHKKPCEMRELDVDPKALRKAGISGSLYSVAASIKPDSNIKRYEITALQR